MRFPGLPIFLINIGILNLHTTLLVLIFSLFFGSLYAQPPNDNCDAPRVVSFLDGTCISIYSTVGATFDIVQPACFMGTDVPNVWFEFTADSPDLIVDFGDLGGGFNMNIALLEVSSCTFAGVTQLACATGPPGEILNVGGLTVGTTYTLLVSLYDSNNDPVESNFELCLTNIDLTAPPNDDPCSATSIPANGTCTAGTTVGANPDFANNLSTCPNVPDQGVFFTFTATAGNLLAEIDITDFTGSAELTVVFGQFISGCNGAFTFNPSVYCGGTGIDVIPDAFIVPGESYYIWVATTAANEGTFEVCVTQVGPPPGCSVNNTCSTAEDLGTITSNAGATCEDGCNILASPGGITGLGCNLETEETVWYEFTTDASATLANILVTSSDIDDPILQVFQWNCSGNPTVVGNCVTGAAGEANIQGLDILPNTTYLIGVSNEFGNGGNFEICLNTTDDANACANGDNTLETVPPGLTGPFLPGESVTFRFTVDNWTSIGNGCQWFQGIVPIFGNGWDTNSFNGADFNVQGIGAGTWDWYGQGVVDYNNFTTNLEIEDLDGDGDIDICHSSWLPNCIIDGTMPNDPMPAGWYATDDGMPINNAWGDGNCCNCNMGPYVIEFTITTLEYVDCSALPEDQGTDLSISIFTFADGETGDWNGGASTCASDIPETLNLTLNCCIGPEAEPATATICPGDALNVVLQTDPIDPNASFSWEVISQGNTSGANSGSGLVIGDVITNNSTSTQTVIYEVTASDESGCPGLESQVVVTVLPNIEVDAGDDIDGCEGVQAVLGGSPTATGGAGVFSYDWGDPAIDNVSNPTATPALSATYVLTVTDFNGCTSTDEINLFINPSFDVEITGDTILCFNDPETVFSGSPLGGTANYSFDWNGAGINGFPGQTISYNGNIVGSGDYTLNLVVTDAFGCTGETEVSVNILDEPSLFIVSTPESGEFCPGGSVLLQAAAVNGDPLVNYNYSWTTPSGGQLNGQTINVTESGEYTLEVFDDLIGCTVEGTYVVTEVPPPTPMINAPEGLCNNDEVFISTMEEYESYEWSTNENTDSIMVGPGTYTVTVTSSAGCTGEQSITINPFMDPSVSISGATTFCEGSSSILSVSDDFANFQWTDVDGNIIGDTDTLLVELAGMYSVLVTDTNGCTALGNQDVMIQDFLIPSIAGDTSICPTESTTLDVGSGFVSYEWSTLDTVQSIEVTEAGSYSVTVFDAGGCSGEQTVIVTENELPEPMITGEDGAMSFCPNSSLNLDAGAGFSSYSWSTLENGQTISVSTAGDYIVTVTDAEGCEGTAIITVEENEPPTPTFTGNTTFCPGDSVLITPEDGYTSYDIDVDNNGIVDFTTVTNEPFYVSTTGFSNVIVTDANGCTGSVLIEVDEFTLPSPVASSDTFSYCTDGFVFIGLTEDFETIEWFLNGDPVGNGQSIQVSEEGEYIAIVTDGNNCQTSASTIVIESTELTPLITGETAICDSTAVTLDAGEGFAIYDWGDFGDTQTIQVTEANTYFVTVTDMGGCSGVDEIVVTSSLTPVANVESSIDVCNNSDGDNTALLNMEALVSGAQGFWTDEDGVGVDLSDLSNVDFTDVIPGFYNFTYTTSIAIEPCENQSYPLTVEVGECLCPSVSLGSLLPVCGNGSIISLDSLQLTEESGSWSVIQGDDNILNGLIIDPSSVNAGTYVFEFSLEQASMDCDSTNTITLEVIAPPNPGIFDESMMVCFNSPTQVNLFDLIEGEDQGGSWVETSSNPSSEAAFDASGSFNTDSQFVGMYSFMYTVEGTGPCESESSEVQIEIQAPPVADAGDDAMLNCDLLVVEIGSETVDGNTYSWTEVKGETVLDETTSSLSVDVEGTYVVEVMDLNQCVDTDTVIVTVNTDFPEVVTEGADPFCADETTGSIVAIATAGNGPYEFSIDNGATWTDDNSFMNLPAGTYTVLVQDQNECTGEVQIELENPTDFIADIGSSIFGANISDTLITLEITGGAENLQAAIWTVNDSIVCEGPQCLSYSVNAEQDTEVCVVATSLNGCIDSTCITVRSLDLDLSYTGNVFTPNDDGNNDVFYIQGGDDIEVVNYMRVYNRWGELVFNQESFPANAIEFGWDGKFKGKRLNPGVFVYTYEVVYDSGGVELIYGDITIAN